MPQFKSILVMADICVQVGVFCMSYFDLLILVVILLIIKELKD